MINFQIMYYISNSKAEIDILSKQINKIILSNESTRSNITIRALEKKEDKKNLNRWKRQ